MRKSVKNSIAIWRDHQQRLVQSTKITLNAQNVEKYSVERAILRDVLTENIKGFIVNKPQKGKYVCLQYGERFHKVMDMREYLCEDHKFVFIYETKFHSTDAGL